MRAPIRFVFPTFACVVSLVAACRPVEPECSPGTRPVVMAHGLLAAGDTWATQQQRFASNGHCAERVRAFDWNTLGEADAVPQLDAFIDALLAETGETQVDLVGHSAGGFLGYRYLAEPARAAKVAHYAHVGSGVQEQPAGPDGAPVPTLNVWSDGDRVIQEKGDIAGATNVMLPGLDHYEVATGPGTFGALWKFFKGTDAASTALAPFGAATLEGRAMTLGENTPLEGATIEIYALDDAGKRQGDARARFTTKADGAWGPFEGDVGVRYEFLVKSADPDDLPVHYYREPFVRPSRLVYLRTLPPADTIAGGLLAGIKYDDAHSVVVVFGANRALLDTRDTLSIDGAAVDLTSIATAAKTTIALFTYDADRDGTSDGTPIASLGVGAFLAGLDLFHAAGDRTIPVTYDGRTLSPHAWKSASDGVSVVVFE